LHRRRKMNEISVSGQSVGEAYMAVLAELRTRGDFIPCQGRDTYECNGARVRIDSPRNCIPAPDGRKFNYRYMVTEALWNLCPTAKLELLKVVHPGIGRFVEDQPENDRASARWAYGPQISDQLGPLIDLLRRRPETRRAILRPGHATRIEGQIGTPPCLELIQFLLRRGALEMVVFMRSNDAYLGMPYDMFTYSLWQQALATALGVGVGPYLHMVGSMHFYVRDHEKVIEFSKHWNRCVALESKPDLSEAADGLLIQDLASAYFYLTMTPRSSVIPEWRAGTWAPLLDVVVGAYDVCEPAFARLRAAGHGIGW
jgi:thymidylate synthase